MKRKKATVLLEGTMYVVFVAYKRLYNKAAGGIESMGRRVIQGLDDSNIPVTLVSKDHLPDVVFERSRRNEEITSRQLLPASTMFVLYTLKELLLSLSIIPSTLRAIKKARKHNLVPVILASDDNFSSLPAFIASLMTNSPYIVQTHALYERYIAFFTKSTIIQNLLLKIQKLTIVNSDMVLNTNCETKDYFSSNFSLPSAKNSLLCTPIDTVLFSPNSVYRGEIRNEFGIDCATYVIGFVGRLSLEKNVQLLLHAYSEGLKASIIPINTVVLIVGDGPLKARLVELSIELSISNKVIFTSFRNDVHKIMNAIDTLVLPSQVEGLPCAALEAMSCGVPMLCSNLPSHADLLEKAKCGFTFDVERVQELIDCLSNLSRNPFLRRELGINGRSYIEKYHSISSVIAEYQKALLTSIKTRCPS